MKESLGRRRVLTWLGNFSFTIPFLIVYILFILYPVVQAIIMSFFDWDLLGNTPEWLGNANYVRMLGGTNIIWGVSRWWFVQLVLLVLAVLVGIWAYREKRIRSGEILLVISLVVVAILLGFHPGPGGSWNDPRFWNAFKNTVIFTLVSTPLIAGVGLGFAMLLQRGSKVTGVYRAALFLPYLLPVSVATLIWG